MAVNIVNDLKLVATDERNIGSVKDVVREELFTNDLNQFFTVVPNVKGRQQLTVARALKHFISQQADCSPQFKAIQQDLIKQKPDRVLVADNCIRMEMGGTCAQIKNMLNDLAYQTNKAIVDTHWIVEAPWLDVHYALGHHGIGDTMRIENRFKVEQGLIQHIEIIFNTGTMQPVILEINEGWRTNKK